MAVAELKRTGVDVRSLMEKWERWRHERSKLGYGKTILEKCLEGMPGTNCPTCQGRGKTNSYPTCPTCSGNGTVKLDPSATKGKVNPAFIASTHRLPDDETSEKIDRLICEMRAHDKTKGYYYVLIQEYTRIGTQEMKAERMHLTHNNYRVKLHRAHDMVSIGLGYK